jgi:hypothetical protein
MGLLRTTIWTLCAVAFGIFLARFSVNGKTLLERGESAWRDHSGPAKVEHVKEQIIDKVDDAKVAIKAKLENQPVESHSEKDRDAVNKLVAKRGTK